MSCSPSSMRVVACWRTKRHRMPWRLVSFSFIVWVNSTSKQYPNIKRCIRSGRSITIPSTKLSSSSLQGWIQSIITAFWKKILLAAWPIWRPRHLLALCCCAQCSGICFSLAWTGNYTDGSCEASIIKTARKKTTTPTAQNLLLIANLKTQFENQLSKPFQNFNTNFENKSSKQNSTNIWTNQIWSQNFKTNCENHFKMYNKFWKHMFETKCQNQLSKPKLKTQFKSQLPKPFPNQTAKQTSKTQFQSFRNKPSKTKFRNTTSKQQCRTNRKTLTVDCRIARRQPGYLSPGT